ncbi:MAG: hypothetical protein ACFFBD_03980 [Candidatus Hodarchaeota archaeon]
MLSIKRVVLYKHGVGYFERRGEIQDNQVLNLFFKVEEMRDVLKSLTVLDLSGLGQVTSVSYDSTKPIEKLLEDVNIRIPDHQSLTSLLGQVKGASIRIAVGNEILNGVILGVETVEKKMQDYVLQAPHLVIMGATGGVQMFDLLDIKAITFEGETIQKDIRFYLSTALSSKKKDMKSLSIFTHGEGERELLMSYVIEAPVWKTTYRIVLSKEQKPAFLQGWGIVDNTSDEDWIDVDLALVSGLPISFIHDLYTPRYKKRPVIDVQEEEAMAPMEIEEAMYKDATKRKVRMAINGKKRGSVLQSVTESIPKTPPPLTRADQAFRDSIPTKTMTREMGDLFQYVIAMPVTIKRNQSALVPIVQEDVNSKRVLLFNEKTGRKNPMACLEIKNTTELTLEGGPMLVMEENEYVGEAMLPTIKPDEKRLVPFAVELGCVVDSEFDTKKDAIYLIVARKGTITTYYTQRRHRAYIIKNKSKKEHTLYIEHPRQAEWELFETTEPEEVTSSFWRFRLSIKPGPTKFIVQEKRRVSSSFSLRNITRQNFEIYIKQKYFPENIIKLIEEILTKNDQIAQLEEEISIKESEISDVFNDQQRIRENLKAFGESAEERKLKERFIAKLNTQEDFLESTRKWIAEQQDQIKMLRQEVDDLLKQITYEKELK